MREPQLRSAEFLQPGTWRPLPTPTWVSQPFWDAAAEKRLVVQRCADCGQFVFRPQFACTRCLSTTLVWVGSSGVGTLHSFSIVRRPAYPDLPDVYAVATVEFDEGWFMLSNLINCFVADVVIGLRVQVVFQPYDGLTLPFLEPA